MRLIYRYATYSFHITSSFSLLAVTVIAKSIIQPSSGNSSSDQVWRLDNFNKDLFWEEPPEGMHLFLKTFVRSVRSGCGSEPNRRRKPHGICRPEQR